MSGGERARAKVFFTPCRTPGKRSLVGRSGRLLESAGLRDAVAENDLVAVKMHFGERGNTAYVQPAYVREVVARVKAAGGKPFLTDANTLYRGQRFNAVDHVACAIHNGFSYATVEAPIVIADGLDGREGVEVEVRGTHFDRVRMGAAAARADAMVVVTHFKGHEATGFGGALKNVGMGLGVRSAKQLMHADFRPEVDLEKCVGCGRCAKWCPQSSIVISHDRKALIDYVNCYGCGECVAACPHEANKTQWVTDAATLQEKVVEHAAGALAGKEGKVVCLTFVTQVSPDCDCWDFNDAPLVHDIGVLSSSDPVAIDQAACDLCTQAPGSPGSRAEGLAAGEDKFSSVTGIDGGRMLEYAEEMGLGRRDYDLETLD